MPVALASGATCPVLSLFNHATAAASSVRCAGVDFVTHVEPGAGLVRPRPTSSAEDVGRGQVVPQGLPRRVPRVSLSDRGGAPCADARGTRRVL